MPGYVTYGQSGYVGASMSERAAAAYENGEAPKSKWTKKAMLAVLRAWCGEELRVFDESIAKLGKDEIFERFFTVTSWHHTGKFANATDFYGIWESAACEAFPPMTEEEAERFEEAERERIAAIDEARRLEREARERRAAEAMAEREAYIEANGFAPGSVAELMRDRPELCEVRTSRKGNLIVEWARSAEAWEMGHTSTCLVRHAATTDARAWSPNLM
jgi:hypothetical protein